MKQPFRQCGYVSQQPPKTGIVEPVETAAARQRPGKHVSTATNTRNNRITVGGCAYMVSVSHQIFDV
jgi:hypothetical protein